MSHPRKTHRPWIAAIRPAIAVAILAAAPAARAQSAEAEALFEQGNRLMAEARLAEACEAFDASRRIEPRAGTLIRLGDCREANHQLASAWASYKDALARVKDPRKRDIATAKVAELEPRLSHLRIEIADDARVDGLVISRSGNALDPGLWNQSIPVDGGDLVIAARAPGYQEWRTPVTVPEAGATITISIPRLLPVAPVAPVVLPAPAPPVSLLPDAPGEPASPLRWTPMRKAALAAAGAGAAALALAAVLGSQATSLERDAFQACPDPATPCAASSSAQATLDRGHRRALYANLSLGLGAGALAAATALWFLGAPRDASAIALAPSLDGRVAGLAVTGGF